MSFFENSVFAQKMYAICNALTDAYDYIYDLKKYTRKKPIPPIYQSFVSEAMPEINKMYHNNRKRLQIDTVDDLTIKEKIFFSSTVSNGEFSFIANLILVDVEQTEYFYGYTSTDKSLIDIPIPYVKDISEMTQSINQQMEIIVCTPGILKAILTYHGYYRLCWKKFFPRAIYIEQDNHIHNTMVKLSMSAFRYNYYKCLDSEIDHGLDELYGCVGMLSDVMRNLFVIYEDDFEYFSLFIKAFPDFAEADSKYIEENLLNHGNTDQVQE